MIEQTKQNWVVILGDDKENNLRYMSVIQQFNSCKVYVLSQDFNFTVTQIQSVLTCSLVVLLPTGDLFQYAQQLAQKKIGRYLDRRIAGGQAVLALGEAFYICFTQWQTNDSDQLICRANADSINVSFNVDSSDLQLPILAQWDGQVKASVGEASIVDELCIGTRNKSKLWEIINQRIIPICGAYQVVFTNQTYDINGIIKAPEIYYGKFTNRLIGVENGAIIALAVDLQNNLADLQAILLSYMDE